MRIFFSVGEPSGDLHGANLIRALRSRRPDVECVGYGGPQMAAAGARLHADLTTLAVMWFGRVFAHLSTFLTLLRQADRYFRNHRPDCVVMIDYPGFNWWIARRARAHGIPVVYYVPPQIWAWAGWRVAKMRRFVDHILCSLPFEPAWYAERGCRATFVGHPFFDEVRRPTLDESLLDSLRSQPGPLLTILPGSRSQEVESNLPWFLRTAELVRRTVPNVRLAVAAFKPQQARRAEQLVAAAGMDAPVFVGRTPELIHTADCCLACSGSVSLELLYHARPTVIGYRSSPTVSFLQHYLRTVPYITLVNLLGTGRIRRDRRRERSERPADDPRMLFPEFYSDRDMSAEASLPLIRWLTDRDARRATVERLERLREQVGGAGASAAAADYLLRVVDDRSGRPPRPHYLSPVDGAVTMRS